MDWKDQHLDQEQKHHLQDTADAMNLPSNEFGDTLDAIFVSILEDLTVIHASNLCHRDGKSMIVIYATACTCITLNLH